MLKRTPLFSLSIIAFALMLSSCSRAKLKHEGLFRIRENGKFGFIDKSGKVVINPQFDDARDFSEGLAGVKMGEKWGYIDTSGKVVINPQFGYETDFTDGLALVINENDRSYIDKTGKIAFKAQGDENDSFHEGLARFKKGDKYGFIDKSGKVVIEPQFAGAGDFSEGLAAVMLVRGQPEYEFQTRRILNGWWGYIDKTGKLVIKDDFKADPHEIIAAYEFKGGRALVKKEGKWVFINKNGEVVTTLQPDARAWDFSEGLSVFVTGGKWEFSGPPYERNNPLYYSYSGGKYGFMNETGRIVIAQRYESASSFSEGLAAVRIDGKWGYIDTSGKVVINPQFDASADFSDGLAYVCPEGQSLASGKCGYIDTTGKFVWSGMASGPSKSY